MLISPQAKSSVTSLSGFCLNDDYQQNKIWNMMRKKPWTLNWIASLNQSLGHNNCKLVIYCKYEHILVQSVQNLI